MNMNKKLTKSENKMLAGICGGIGDFLEIDPTIVRVIYAGGTIFTGFVFGAILYLVLCIIFPNQDSK